MKQIEGDLHKTNISGIYRTEIGSFKIRQIGTLFFLRYKKDNCHIRNSPWVHSLSGIGGMNCRRGNRRILLQMFFGITDPLSIIGLYLLIAVVLKVVSKETLSVGFLMSISVVITTCVVIITFFATALSGKWRAESKTIERVIEGLFKQSS